MSMTRAELQDAADKAFGQSDLAPDANKAWDLIAEMGFLMMAVPEAQGGLGLGLEAAGVVHSALGRTLVPGPAIAQMLVIEALSAADSLADRHALIERAMGGEVMTASLALRNSATLLTCVPDADRASHVLLVEEARIALLPMDGLAITPRDTWDKTRRLFDVSVDGAATPIILAEGEAATKLAQRLSAQRSFALAADSLGGANAILRLTIDYLETRHQFDRPLALFQALKHRVADLKTAIVAAEALLWERSSDDVAGMNAMGAVKAHACSVYRMVTEEAVQLHGGIGLTMEHHCHLFLKRAMLNAALGGDADHWEEETGRQALKQATS